ncbi:MAG: hypothetical protein H6741_07030 [Alphaproteobacteria bacterium]|nr:hypothetical protein [Alphaproteobacteria bacterium]
MISTITRSALVWGVLGLVGAADAQEGGCAADLNALDAALDDAERAFAAMDEAGYDDARARAEQALGCLEVPITPRLSADYHRLMALTAFGDLDAPSAVLSLQAMLAIQPHYHFTDPLVPPGDHPLHELLERAQAGSPGVPITVDMPRGTVLRIDGARAVERQSALPAVVQVLSDEGEVLWGGYVLPTDPLPPADLPTLPRSPRQRVSRGLIAGGASLVVLGGASLVTASVYEGQARDYALRIGQGDASLTAADGPRYETIYTRANAFGYAGQAALLAGVALGGVGVAFAF